MLRSLRRKNSYQADNTDLLVAPVLDVLLPGLATEVPLSSVDLGTLERLQALNIGPAELAQDANTGKEEVSNVLELLGLAGLLLRGALESQVPLAGLLVVASGGELVAALDVRPELVLLDGVLEVSQDLGAWRVEGRPIGLRQRNSVATLDPTRIHVPSGRSCIGTK